jgi:hypothetical protein
VSTTAALTLELDWNRLSRFLYQQVTTRAIGVLTTTPGTTTSPQQNIRLLRVDAWGAQGGSVRLQWSSVDAAAIAPLGMVDLNVGVTDRPFVSEWAPSLCWDSSSGSGSLGQPLAIYFTPGSTGSDNKGVVYYHLECW